MWDIGGKKLESRLLIGSARYPSHETMCEAIKMSASEVVTVSLRRLTAATKDQSDEFHNFIRYGELNVLPNTAGCYTVKEAVTTAQMARELFGTNWIKLEVLSRDKSLLPDVFSTVEAAEILCKEGFEVFPYTTDDITIAARLVDAGCNILMPLAAPIGSRQGIQNPQGLQRLRKTFPDTILIVDAGLGKPSHAARVMEMGYDGVLLNTAIASAGNPVLMAVAFMQAIRAGRQAYEAGVMQESDAQASSPETGIAFRSMPIKRAS